MHLAQIMTTFQHEEYAVAFKLFGGLHKTSMMWISQNFLLYNGIVIKIKVNEWINNKKLV